MSYDMLVIADRVLDKVSILPNGCAVFNGALDQGYGTIKVEKGRTKRRAHRVVYEALIGPVADGKCLDHLCRNRACVNPYHLEQVTPVENVMRGTGISAVNARKKRCIRGHVLDSANTYLNPRGQRQCRNCSNRRSREYRSRNRALSSA